MTSTNGNDTVLSNAPAFVNVSAVGDVAIVTLDDGKANVFSRANIAATQSALDATADARAIVLTGRPRMFSAGLDLREVQSDPSTQRALRNEFMRLVLRVFVSETPVVAACTGHALAGGAALLLAADRRVALEGDWKIGFNEVAAGVPLSGAFVELCRYRMAMPWFESIVVGTVFDPVEAVTAGLVDEVAGDPLAAALETAEKFATFNRRAFSATKTFARRPAAASMSALLDASEARGS